MVGIWPRPADLIRVHRGGSAFFECGVAEAQGCRPNHEDAHAVLLGGVAGEFWVLDGHRGDRAARFGAQALPEAVGGCMQKSVLPNDDDIESGFKAVDQRLRRHMETHRWEGNPGSTVVAAFVVREDDGTYHCKLANCGDSRGILIHGMVGKKTKEAALDVRLPTRFGGAAGWKKSGVQVKSDSNDSWIPAWPAILETIDHKPHHPPEMARIIAAGGRVTTSLRQPRLDGQLAVCRGLGDFDFKDDQRRSAAAQKVSCVPDVYEASGLSRGTLLVLACDGVWAVMSSDMAAAFVRGQIEEDPEADLGDVAAALVRACLDTCCKDNITVLVARFDSPGKFSNDTEVNLSNARSEIVGFARPTSPLGLSEEDSLRRQKILSLVNFPPESFIHFPCENYWKPSLHALKKAPVC